MDNMHAAELDRRRSFYFKNDRLRVCHTFSFTRLFLVKLFFTESHNYRQSQQLK